MKNQRVQVFRSALEGLLESLDAFVRLARWSEADPTPDPLKVAAAKLMDRLGTAERLAAGKFNGTPVEANRVDELCAFMRKLDAAYVKYRRAPKANPEGVASACLVLEAEIGEVAAAAGSALS